MRKDHRLYLDDILGAIERIQSYVEGMDYPRFAADQRTMDAVIRNLEIIGEAARSFTGRDQRRHTADRLAENRRLEESPPARIFCGQHPGGVGCGANQTGPPSDRLP